MDGFDSSAEANARPAACRPLLRWALATVAGTHRGPTRKRRPTPRSAAMPPHRPPTMHRRPTPTTWCLCAQPRRYVTHPIGLESSTRRATTPRTVGHGRPVRRPVPQPAATTWPRNAKSTHPRSPTTKPNSMTTQRVLLQPRPHRTLPVRSGPQIDPAGPVPAPTRLRWQGPVAVGADTAGGPPTVGAGAPTPRHRRRCARSRG